jgi:2,4-didehydro-3-deoxy-L-rhamnonate hydrolase
VRFCRFNNDRIGVVRGDKVHDVTKALEKMPPLHYPLPFGDALIAHLDVLRPEMERLADSVSGQDVRSVHLNSPVANPSKIVATPANYAAHAEEAKADPEIAVYQGEKRKTIREQGLFLKSASSLVGPSDGVSVRFPDRRTDHEVELGVIFGKRARCISEEDALSCVAGYAIALDMSVRGKEDRSYRKSADSYSVLGPWVVTADELGDPTHLDFWLKVNGELKQESNTALMLVSLPAQIAWASTVYDLHPGDILMTGTCQGVGPVKSGDVMTAWIQNIGVMEVPVRSFG